MRRISNLFLIALFILSIFNVSFAGRYYIPEIARWATPDPMLHLYPSWSPYNFVLNNPLRYIDPTGMVVEIADETNQKQHDAFYNQVDTDGNFVNTDYRSQYDQLHSSDVVYNVVAANLGGADASGTMTLGNFTTDGTNAVIELDIANGATIGQELSHEFVHGLQFEAGQIYFGRNSASEKWYTQGMTIGIEYDAFAGQQIKESWWKPGNTAHNTAKVNKLYPSLMGNSPKPTEPWSQRLVLRTPTYFGISLPKK